MVTHHGPRGPSPSTRWPWWCQGFLHQAPQAVAVAPQPLTLHTCVDAWWSGRMFLTCIYPMLDRRCGCSNLSSIAAYIWYCIYGNNIWVSLHVTQNGEILYTWHVFFYLRCWKNHGFSPLGRSTSPRPMNTAGGSMHVPQVPLYPSVVTSASADVESCFGLFSTPFWCREDSWRFWRETLRPVLSPGRWDLQQDAQMKSGVTMGASIIARSFVLLGRRECNPLIQKQLIFDIRFFLRPRGGNVPCGLWKIPGHKEQLKSNSRTSHLANQTLPDSFVWRLARPGNLEQPQACSTGVWMTEAIPNMMPGCGDAVDCNGWSVSCQKGLESGQRFFISKSSLNHSWSFGVYFRTCGSVSLTVCLRFGRYLMVYRICRMLAAVQILTNLPWLGHDQEMLWNHFAPLCLFMLEYCKEGECLTVFKPLSLTSSPRCPAVQQTEVGKLSWIWLWMTFEHRWF